MPFVDSNLPLVTVDTGGVEIPNEVRIPATMRVIRDPTGARSNLETTPNDFVGNVQIEIRGHYSTSFPKKQYGFETKNTAGGDLHVSLLGMPAEEDWILQGPYRDKIFFRNAFAYDLSNKMGRYAVRTRFVEAFIKESGSGAMADHYAGVFVLMERIKRDPGRVHLQPLGGSTEPGVTGGWILKIDKGDDPFFVTVEGTKILHVYPKGEELTTAQIGWIKEYFNDFESALASGGDYSQYIDTASFVDYFLVNELMKNVDAYRISTYMQKDRGAKLRMGPVWDFDLSSTTVDRGKGESSAPGWITELEYFGDTWQTPFWWKALLQDESFVREVIARWCALRRSVLHVPALFGTIDDWAALLDEAQARNYERWPDALTNRLGSEPVAYPSFAGEVEEFKTFLDERIRWIDEHIYELLPGNIAVGLPTFLRVHDEGTGYGLPADSMDVEVVVKLDTEPQRSFGFQLRDGANEAIQRGMLDTLRDAFNKGQRVQLDYSTAGPSSRQVLRVVKIPC